MFRPTLIAAFASLALVAVAGCSSEEDGDMTKVSKSCVKTACDVLHDRDSQACSACTSACFGASFDCDPSERCAISCGESSKCSESDRTTCKEEGFTVELPKTKSAALADACKRMFARHEACGVNTTPFSSFDCETWAKTERPERARDYDCVAGLPCEEDESACAVAPTDFGDRLCDAMAATCEDAFCDDGTRETLNLHGAWLKDSVMQAAMSCAGQETCGDARACLQAWASAARL